ncbi:hypothetical protein [Myroides sp. DW712]|uniref:hypothetical protein n=1 Tax=Myroides sp. DW712 TaxID=3389800 RepID=UPI00397D722F
MKKYKGFLFCLSFLMVNLVQAQVTIGTDKPSEQAALLDVKSQEPTSDNITSTTGGVLLPRVQLVDVETLEPFIHTTDAAWIDATSKETLSKEHTGLEVYNLTDNTSFKPGSYVWNGKQWESLFKPLKPRVNHRIVFPMPAFNLPLIDPEDPDNMRLKVDLHQMYMSNRRVNHFRTNMEDVTTFIVNNYYRANQLDYVVTHYDKAIITIHGIDNDGVMDYTVHNVNPDATAFLNIYLVVHKGQERN